jgi:hypothetical protein
VAFNSNMHNDDAVSAPEVSRSLQHGQKMTFTVNKLIGSDKSVGAAQIDPNLINPWGISESATSPFWISDNGSGVTTIDVVAAGSVTLDALAPITIATPTGQDPATASPTGQVFNAFQADGAFMLSDANFRHGTVDVYDQNFKLVNSQFHRQQSTGGVRAVQCPGAR